MNKEQFLAMSLPHELKVLRGDNITILKVSGIDVDCKSILFTEKNTTTYGNINHSKPICHPLSDLTKPITHKGETFIPIVKLANYPDEIGFLRMGYEKKNYFASFGYSDHIVRYNVPASVSDMNFYQISKLVEWHFNLMDESEPFIDVNTLEINPYK